MFFQFRKKVLRNWSIATDVIERHSDLNAFINFDAIILEHLSGLPATLADKINADVAEILQKPDIKDKLRSLRLDPMGGTPADAAKFFAGETELWGKVIAENHIVVE